ncbi:unnamed protein product [Cuscuta europaea]|uniref:Uncharacterized protein n=1 Tax=Cuscuta europaea TaxID=41803 RepID=A0A9P0ZH46_CUSEU|nr:unnamed protein product [Cuscuta europaea]
MEEEGDEATSRYFDGEEAYGVGDSADEVFADTPPYTKGTCGTGSSISSSSTSVLGSKGGISAKVLAAEGDSGGILGSSETKEEN